MTASGSPGYSQATLNHHGGNLEAARRRFPGAPEPWIDLSTGINSDPYPVGPISPSAWQRLPEAAQIRELEAIAARRYGASFPERVVAAPGTQALIQWLPRIIGGKRVGVLGFSYGEHREVWEASGATVSVVDDLRQLAGFDVAVIVNPNNPDGRLIAAGELREFAASVAQTGGALVIDEAFMDVVTPSQSIIPDLSGETSVVLRSFGKAYGLAGVRLGFAVCSGELATVLRSALGPWAVSGAALEIGSRALSDQAWLDAAIGRLGINTARLDALLMKTGFSIVGGIRLYRLYAHETAQDVFEHLGNAGILVRTFAEKPHWLRFGIPQQEAHWVRIEQALLP
jgi:cobalamin biosynthetic protein CobC